ncbi:MAG: mandelate racemase/muconate lactonizing enzyme family protein [Sphaerochaetaceae bacterium]|nr:mandelate racemase/muconate lactonizing enzyme family protein [Sphaerochaetaceae bacterium]
MKNNLQIEQMNYYPVKIRSNGGGGVYWFLIKLTTNTGVEGWGEIIWNPFNADTLGLMCRDFYLAYVKGQNPFDIERIYLKAFSVLCKSHSCLNLMGIISGFEIALCDIIGKITNQPIYNLFGGKVNQSVRSYTYLYDPKDEIFCEDFWTMSDACAKRAKEYVDMGFTAIKLDPTAPYLDAYEVHYPLQKTIDHSVETIGKIRDAVGETVDIIIGTHGQFTAAGAISFAKAMEQFHPLWFEEPTPPGNPAILKKVSEATTIPIATGERLATKFDYTPYIEDKSVDIYQIDISGVGGLFESKKIASMCEAFHTLITTHFWAGPVNFAAQLQLASCCPNFLIQESIDTMGDFGGFNKVLDTPFLWKEGDFYVSDKPGLGLDLNETKLREYVISSYDEKNVLI